MSQVAAVSSSAQSLTAGEWTSSKSTSAQLPTATLTGLDPCRRYWPPRSVLLIGPSSAAPGWLGKSLERLNHLLALPPNWDSYGAKCIDPYRVVQTLRLLAEVMEDRTPPPQIVPTPDGGVQLEWHEHSIDLEIEVVAGAKVLVGFEDSLTGTLSEEILAWDSAPLAEMLETLVRRKASC